MIPFKGQWVQKGTLMSISIWGILDPEEFHIGETKVKNNPWVWSLSSLWNVRSEPEKSACLKPEMRTLVSGAKDVKHMWAKCTNVGLLSTWVSSELFDFSIVPEQKDVFLVPSWCFLNTSFRCRLVLHVDTFPEMNNFSLPKRFWIMTNSWLEVIYLGYKQSYPRTLSSTEGQYVLMDTMHTKWGGLMKRSQQEFPPRPSTVINP